LCGDDSRHGFTLLELLVVIAIVGIVGGLSIVGWSSFLARLKSHGTANQIRDALVLARMDAKSRLRNTGVLLDTANDQFLVFVDSFAGGPTGRYVTGDLVLTPWTTLPSKPVFASISSSSSPDPVPRPCMTAGTGTVSTPQTGNYSIVFRPDGRSWVSFQAKLVTPKITDTFLVGVLPTTGLITLEQRP
jgi:prepilin-type N-terminal cleavage/methylation domain-containing protein